jgi:hypothetical protein
MDRTNVETVIVAGKVRTWKGRLLDVDLPVLRRQLEDSRDDVFNAAATCSAATDAVHQQGEYAKPDLAALMRRKPFNMQRAGAHRPARSGNPAASASRVAGITPRSVMSPPTSRAGVTSKA